MHRSYIRRPAVLSNSQPPPSTLTTPIGPATAVAPFALLQLYSVDVATGSGIQRLTFSPGNRTGGMGGKPSSCGRYLAFASDKDSSMPAGLFDLYVVRLGPAGLPVGSLRRLTRGAANQFSRSWSPDSKYLAFNSQVRGPGPL
jgi:Tol biopolymer transport system component